MTERSFEIGLVGAGAISAGAYTGGVIDFMVHALDCWYAAKGTDPSEWTWWPTTVRLKIEQDQLVVRVNTIGSGVIGLQGA